MTIATTAANKVMGFDLIAINLGILQESANKIHGQVREHLTRKNTSTNCLKDMLVHGRVSHLTEHPKNYRFSTFLLKVGPNVTQKLRGVFSPLSLSLKTTKKVW